MKIVKNIALVILQTFAAAVISILLVWFISNAYESITLKEYIENFIDAAKNK